jgi:hypothetical protein
MAHFIIKNKNSPAEKSGLKDWGVIENVEPRR